MLLNRISFRRSRFWRSLSYLALIVAYALLIIGVVWMLAVPVIIIEKKSVDSGRTGTIKLVARIIDSEDASPTAARCWVPYYDTTVMGVVHLQVDQVLAGEFPHEQLLCFDHLNRLPRTTIKRSFGVELELEWSPERDLYIVCAYRPAPLPITFFWYFGLPVFLAGFLVKGAQRFLRWSNG